jgi:hypothetical protein
MRDNDYRDVESRELSHSGEGFRLKRGVADGEDFIHNQDVRLEVRVHCKPEPRLHAARVPLDRRIDEARISAKSTISSNLRVIVVFRLDLFARKSFDGECDSGH